ncbi:MAG: ATP-dependent helicase HrpB [Alphaproteobacteria bacterium]|nr:ATP-dependent helicase HrpB [Alphaproteobacteria bacterium]
MDRLPVEDALPALLAALEKGGNAVLTAPPGAGKTTLVPPALAAAGWARQGKILAIEPRRLAARAAARRMAALAGQPVGRDIGYRVRLDAKPGRRIEALTPGVYLRLLQERPDLGGVAAVLFDEIHERALEIDLALALTREAQGALRPDLRLVAMSATLDAGPIARLLGDAPVVGSQGRSYPVSVAYLERDPEDAVAAMAPAVRRMLRERAGDILAFLPGGGEIRRVARQLEDLDELVLPLYGDLPFEDQDRAISPDPGGRRKVVLATAIAETSLTIEGIGTVIDSGLARGPRYDPRSGLTRLATGRVSLAAAEQRRGRAGRLGPGHCLRLWSEPGQRQLAPFTPPEILSADLAPLALELAVWGTKAESLPWLDPPPEAALREAEALLRDLGALDESGRAGDMGRAMAALGTHPRLAHTMLRARDLGLGASAAWLAALIEERDPLRAPPGQRLADLRLRIEIRHRPIVEAARQHRKRLGIGEDTIEADRLGLVAALAYPDRIARRRPGAAPRYLLANGRGAALPGYDPLGREEFLSVVELDGALPESRIFLAAPIDRAEIESEFAARIVAADSIAWDAREGAIQARRERRLGAIVLEAREIADIPPERRIALQADAIRALGLDVLPWGEAARDLRARVGFLHRLDPASWPDWSDDALLASLEDWLGPALYDSARRAHWAKFDLAAALRAQLDRHRQAALEREAPTHLAVPSGRRHAVDYADPAAPVLAVKLQEMFGATASPLLASGRVAVVLHLLSPAGRPLQVTRDLAGFWAGAYAEVKKDMRGRYPRHPWPDDPRAAPATHRAKPRG